MKLLAVDTAFEACSVAVGADGDLEECYAVAPRAHARLLLPWIGELLRLRGLRLGDLDAIAFSRGPGSFTSLRIGTGVVQGLAFGAGLPVVPVSSLQATAETARRERGEALSTALVAMDARMEEVFAARFEWRDGFMRPAGEERVLPPDAAAALARPGDVGVGSGFARYQALFGDAGPPERMAHSWPRAGAVLALAQDWLGRHEALPPEQAQPVYLRDRVAERPGGL